MSEETRRGKKDGRLDQLIGENIEAIARIRAETLSRRSPMDLLVDAIAKFCGRMRFVYIHCIFFAVWLGLNGLPNVPKSWRWDGPPFSILTVVVGLEAIFLSTFILISQNRQQEISDHQDKLDLQINLLAEQENSQMLLMLGRIMEHLGIDHPNLVHEALGKPTDIEKVAKKLNDEEGIILGQQ